MVQYILGVGYAGIDVECLMIPLVLIFFVLPHAFNAGSSVVIVVAIVKRVMANRS